MPAAESRIADCWIGAAAGLSLLFGSDTGVYLIAAVSFYGLLCWGYRPGGKRFLNIPFAWKTGVTMLGTFLGGLSWASRGTCFQPAFWPRYWESSLLYSGGIGSLPMSVGIANPQEFVLLITVLTTYSFAIANALFRLITHRLEATGPCAGAGGGLWAGNADPVHQSLSPLQHLPLDYSLLHSFDALLLAMEGFAERFSCGIRRNASRERPLESPRSRL